MAWLAADRALWNPTLRQLQEQVVAKHADVMAGCDSWEESGARDGACVWNADAAGTPVYLVGDSKAGQLSEALLGATSELGRPLTISTASACPYAHIYLDLPQSPSWWTADGCRAAFERTADWLASAEPGLVIMSSNHVYVLGDSHGVGLDAGSYVRGTDEKARVYEEALVRAVESLRAVGHSVMLVQPGPRFDGWNPQSCTTFSIVTGGCSASVALKEMESLQAPLVAAIESSAVRTDSSTLDVKPTLCPDGYAAPNCPTPGWSRRMGATSPRTRVPFSSMLFATRSRDRAGRFRTMQTVHAGKAIKRVMRLEHVDRLGAGARTVGGRTRLATVTDVVPLDPERIAVTNLVGQTLTIGRWSPRSRRFGPEHVITTRTEAGPASTDLMDFDGAGMILTSDCRAGTASLYEVTAEAPRFVRTITPGGGARSFCHGAAFIPGAERLVALAYSVREHELLILEEATGLERARFELPGWKPKSISVDGAGHLVVPFCDGGPSRSAATSYYGTRVLRLRLDPGSGSIAQVDEVAIPDVHVDATVILDGAILVNDHSNGAIQVIEVGRDGLRLSRTVTGFRFPHGMALSWDREHLLVAQYGDHSVVRVPLDVVFG